MGQFDALERNSVESEQSAWARHPEIPVVRLRQGDGAAQRRALARAPGGVAQLLDGQIGIEGGGAATPEQHSDREPAPLLSTATTAAGNSLH